MNPVIFDPDARAELDRALAASLIPDEFRAAVDALLADVGSNPGYGFTTTVKGVRQVVMSRFPYSVVHTDQPDCVFVVAFAHHRRRTAYWKNRLRTN